MTVERRLRQEDEIGRGGLKEGQREQLGQQEKKRKEGVAEGMNTSA